MLQFVAWTVIPVFRIGVDAGPCIGSVLGMPVTVQVGVLAYAGALVLQFLTLPVELNASKRALQQLEQLGLLGEQEREGVGSSASRHPPHS